MGGSDESDSNGIRPAAGSCYYNGGLQRPDPDRVERRAAAFGDSARPDRPGSPLRRRHHLRYAKPVLVPGGIPAVVLLGHLSVEASRPDGWTLPGIRGIGWRVLGRWPADWSHSRELRAKCHRPQVMAYRVGVRLPSRFRRPVLRL